MPLLRVLPLTIRLPTHNQINLLLNRQPVRHLQLRKVGLLRTQILAHRSRRFNNSLPHNKPQHNNKHSLNLNKHRTDPGSLLKQQQERQEQLAAATRPNSWVFHVLPNSSARLLLPLHLLRLMRKRAPLLLSNLLHHDRTRNAFPLFLLLYSLHNRSTTHRLRIQIAKDRHQHKTDKRPVAGDSAFVYRALCLFPLIAPWRALKNCSWSLLIPF